MHQAKCNVIHIHTFCILVSICRLVLASLHWNENAGRSQATKADGTPQYRISYPKAKEGGHTVSKVLTACTFSEYSIFAFFAVKCDC